ncbi:hypothetical protein [Roseibium album]|uniref:hypothetical protein n=1 Tax=Roseibium album TaxID=311410 RepID=UPI0032ED8633
MARYQPEVIWSTYPISSAHCIASGLATLFGRPWIADMRDPMVDEHYPEDPMKRRAYKSIEERVVRQARYMTFAAPGTRTMYLARYPRWLSQSSSMVIENGFEGQYFEQQRILSSDVQSGPVTLLHSGAIYPTERDPAPLLQSVARIRREGFGADRVRVRFRASGTEERISRISRRLGIQDQVCLDPQLPYREALAEMCNGNVLMIMQGAACNHQIPAKVYEYLQANQPIFGLVADDGDTAELLRRAGVQYLADISDERGIAEAIKRLVAEAEAGVLTSRLDREFVSGCDRRHRSKQLLSLLESCRSTG